MLGIIFLSLLAAAHGLPAVQNERIIGGIEADPGEYPSQVSILLEGNGHYGAGNIISEKWVLTAGHCVFGLQLSEVKILVGTNDLTTGGYLHAPLQFIIHENFEMNDFDVVYNDIGLIEVLEPFILSDLVKPIPLPIQGQAINTGSPVTTIGWGLTDLSTWASPDLLREVDLEIQDQDTCFDIYAAVNKNVYPFEVCAISPVGNLGTCLGDSGGPLLLNGTMVGITSWAESGCATPGFAAVFTRVEYYRDWITQHSGI